MFFRTYIIGILYERRFGGKDGKDKNATSM